MDIRSLLKRLLAIWVMMKSVKTAFRLLQKHWRIHEMRKHFLVPKELDDYIQGYLPVLKKNMRRSYHIRCEILDSVSTKEKKADQILLISPIWSTKLFILNRDPEVVKFILKDEFDSFIKADSTQKVLADLLGKGIFVVNHGSLRPKENSNWMFQRKTAAKIFTRKVFNGHVLGIIEKNTAKILSQIRGATARKEVFDIKKAIYCFTMDSIGDIGFGVDLNTLDSEEVVPFSKAFDEVVYYSAIRTFTPGWEIPFVRLLYKSERMIKEGVRILDEFSYNIINDRKKDPNLAQKGDILSMFLQADPELSDVYLRDIVLSFMIAGRDTSACTLTFAFFLLATHQEIQEKLFQEIKDVLKGNEPSLESLKSLPYLDGVVFESLRLFPPVPQDNKEAARDVFLPDGRKICKGTAVSFEPYVMGRDETLYPSAHKFDPTRWMQDGRNVQEFDQYSFPVFQAGPRICLGKDLALYEVKMLLVKIIFQFSFKLSDDKLPRDWDEFRRDLAMLNGKAIYKQGVTLAFDGELDLEFTNRKLI